MKKDTSKQLAYQSIEVEAGKRYCWCACGLSKKYPMCDGSHRAVGQKSLPFVPEKSGVMQICGCGKTTKPPECDELACVRLGKN